MSYYLHDAAQGAPGSPHALREGRSVPTHPKWWKDRAEARRRQLDAAVERLRDTLPAFDGVRGAFVFGSYARGECGPESDLDILLVRATDLPMLRRDDDVRAKLRLGVPYDLVTITPEQLERLPSQNGFYAQAIREGLWIDAARAD